MNDNSSRGELCSPERYMLEAIKEAKKAYKKDEVPVGAIIVYNNKIIARGHNLKERNNDVTAHAEIVALKKAAKKMKTWRLNDCDIYVTLEPCSMCMSALIQCRIRNIYYGCMDGKSGAIKGAFSLLDSSRFNHVPNTICLNDKKCGDVLKDYFKSKRM